MLRILVLFLFRVIFSFPYLSDEFVMSNMGGTKGKLRDIQEEYTPNLTISEGLVSQTAETIIVKRNNRIAAKVKLGKPVIVAQAEQEEKWGFFQFPNIGKASDGTLIVSWHMREDSHETYGKIGRKYTPMMSTDGGKTWRPQDKDYFAPARGYNGLLNNGRILQVVTPQSKDIRDYKTFPDAVAKIGRRSFYKITELPDELQGVYLQYIGEGSSYPIIHAKLYDPGSLRYTIDHLMPLVWWGNIVQLADSSLVAGVYPCIYQSGLGNVTRSSVSFFRSTDGGLSWKVTGRIPCQADGILDKRGENEFSEPTFESLADSTFICVMRSGSASPMYKTFSVDRGKTWTKPVPFTPNGVNPKVMRLGNGVLVLASGRPGVQLRFSLDGDGQVWTEPIEMLPFASSIEKNDVPEATCGYANIIAADNDSFYIVYSDFKMKNKYGEYRKAIMAREVKVIKIDK